MDNRRATDEPSPPEGKKHRIPFIGEFQSKLTDDAFRYYFQMVLLSFVLGTVSLVMGIMNIFTHKPLLMGFTLVFWVVCYVNGFYTLRKKRATRVTYGIFEVSILVLFTYFLVTGGTADFSPHWILLLPAFGMLFLGEKRGVVVTVIMFAIVVVFLWIPPVVVLTPTNFTPEFRMRFPVVYLAFFAVGYASEKIRVATYNQMLAMQEKLAEIAETDTLTKIHNRYWFNKTLERDYAYKPVPSDGLMLIIDVDNFKQVNDRYGHPVGDKTLVAVADAIKSQIRDSDLLCRWGGEEFFAYLPGCGMDTAQKVCERIRQKIRNTEIPCRDELYITVTVSIGAVYVYHDTLLEPEPLFAEADRRLYIAKTNGKDQVVLSE